MCRNFDEELGLERALALSSSALSLDLRSRSLALASLAALLSFVQVPPFRNDASYFAHRRLSGLLFFLAEHSAGASCKRLLAVRVARAARPDVT